MISYSPESNEPTKRPNQELLDIACAALLSAVPTLPKALWAESINYANDMHNRLWARSNSETKTRDELIHGRQPNVLHLHVFAANNFIHILSKLRKGKFSKRADQGTLTEIDRGDACRAVLKSGKLKISKDAGLNEPASHQTVTCDMSDRYDTFEIPRLESEYFGESDSCDLQVPDADTGVLVASETENIEENKNGNETLRSW